VPGQAFVQRLRNPASAAIAGIIFSLVLIGVIVQFHLAVPDGLPDAGWMGDDSRRGGVRTVVQLIPFAGIAFLWFIGVIRTRLGDQEDRLFATVLLGSGLIFVVLLFVGGALLATALALYDGGMPVGADSLTTMVLLTKAVMGMFGTRMAAVFTAAVCSIGVRTAVLPAWLAALGYATALVLLFSPPITRWGQLLFPAWVLVLSIYILVASRNQPAQAPHATTSG
jgi:hypothetical protein